MSVAVQEKTFVCLFMSRVHCLVSNISQRTGAVFTERSARKGSDTKKTPSEASYSKTCLKRPLSKRPKIGFNTNYYLMQVKSIAECSNGSILQYFRPSFSYYFPLRSLLCLLLSGRLRQVLLYTYM